MSYKMPFGHITHLNCHLTSKGIYLKPVSSEKNFKGDHKNSLSNILFIFHMVIAFTVIHVKNLEFPELFGWNMHGGWTYKGQKAIPAFTWSDFKSEIEHRKILITFTKISPCFMWQTFFCSHIFLNMIWVTRFHRWMLYLSTMIN